MHNIQELNRLSASALNHPNDSNAAREMKIQNSLYYAAFKYLRVLLWFYWTNNSEHFTLKAKVKNDIKRNDPPLVSKKTKSSSRPFSKELSFMLSKSRPTTILNLDRFIEPLCGIQYFISFVEMAG